MVFGIICKEIWAWKNSKMYFFIKPFRSCPKDLVSGTCACTSRNGCQRFWSRAGLPTNETISPYFKWCCISPTQPSWCRCALTLNICNLLLLTDFCLTAVIRSTWYMIWNFDFGGQYVICIWSQSFMDIIISLLSKGKYALEAFYYRVLDIGIFFLALYKMFPTNYTKLWIQCL